jgi:hypothetical protein
MPKRWTWHLGKIQSLISLTSETREALTNDMANQIIPNSKIVFSSDDSTGRPPRSLAWHAAQSWPKASPRRQLALLLVLLQAFVGHRGTWETFYGEPLFSLSKLPSWDDASQPSQPASQASHPASQGRSLDEALWPHPPPPPRPIIPELWWFPQPLCPGALGEDLRTLGPGHLSPQPWKPCHSALAWNP